MEEKRFMGYSHPTQIFHVICSLGCKTLNGFFWVGAFSSRGRRMGVPTLRILGGEGGGEDLGWVVGGYEEGCP